MMHNKSILYLLVLMFAVPLLVSCSTPPPPDTSAEDGRAIKAASAQFVDNFNAHDIAALAAIYAVDAKLIPPNFEMIVGRENIEGWFNEAGGTLQLTMIDLDVKGDMAHVLGDYMINIPMGEGESINDTGNYVEIWKRVNGAWMLDLDIWNSNVPLSAPEEESVSEEEE